MGYLTKSLALLLTLTLTLSYAASFVVESVNAQTAPKPSAPQFTVALVNHAYVVPASTDPYTGVTSGPDTYCNWTIELSITNQAYGYTVDGKACHIYYGVQMKPHYATYEDNWTTANYDYSYDYTLDEEVPEDNASHPFISTQITTPQSNSGHTIINLGQRYYAPQDVGTKIDFRVKAFVGHDAQYLTWAGEHMFDIYREATDGVAYDCSSDWSSTQTLTVTRENVDQNVTFFPLYTYPPDSTTDSQDSTIFAPTQPSDQSPQAFGEGSQFNLTSDQIVIVVMAVVIAVMAVGMVVLFRRTAKKQDAPPSPNFEPNAPSM
jgi:hypothetical protein